MRRWSSLLAIGIALFLASCGAKPIELDVAPGGYASVQIEVSLDEGYKFSGKEAIYATAPELEGINWIAREAVSGGSPVKMELSASPNAAAGTRRGKLELTVTFCEKGGTLCLIRQRLIPLKVSVSPNGAARAAAVYSLKIKP